jgi:LacI family transcriptional regulator
VKVAVKKRTLIHDIANHLNVSIATVSLVLNGKAKEQRISDALTERVLRYVEEVGYKPNQLAKSLRTGKTHVIGLIIEDISNPFFATVARLIEKQALTHGYRIIYCSTENDTTKTKDLITMFQERHIDGYIIAPPPGVDSDVSSLLHRDTPTVLFDRYLPELNTDYVIVDGAGGTFQATQHLLAQGFSHIAYITTDSTQTQLAARLQGYQSAMREESLPELVKAIVLKFGDDDHEGMVAEIEGFIKQNPQCDAIIFANNSLCLYGLEAIARLKLRIPDQLGIISFDDNDMFRLLSPSITAIAQPVAAIAHDVISVLLERLQSDQSTTTQHTKNIVLPTTLIVRDSSQRKRLGPPEA